MVQTCAQLVEIGSNLVPKKKKKNVLLDYLFEVKMNVNIIHINTSIIIIFIFLSIKCEFHKMPGTL